MESDSDSDSSSDDDFFDMLQNVVSGIEICEEFRKRKRKIKITKTKVGNRRYNREYGLRKMREMTDFEFARMFRMNRETFGKLVEIVRPHLQVDEAQARRSSGSPISVTTKVACALRWLAGGSYLDISHLFGVSSENFFSKRGVLWQTLEAIDKGLSISFNVDPRNLEQTAENLQDFLEVV